MPSTVEIFHDAHEEPVREETVEDEPTMRWKGKGKAVPMTAAAPTTTTTTMTTATENNNDTDNAEMTIIQELPADQPPAMDWTKVNPPEELRFIGEFGSELVTQIIENSIERVKARIIEEEEARVAAAEALWQRREDALRAEEVALRVELDNVSKQAAAPSEEAPADESSRPSMVMKEGDSQAVAADDGPSLIFSSDLPQRPKKHIFRNLFRKANNVLEKGETSRAGATRRRNHLNSDADSKDLATHTARKRFVLDILKKASGEESTNSPASSVHEAEVECVSCLDDFNPKLTVQGPCHSYCKPCFRRLVESACQHEQHWPPKCCLNNIPESIVLANLDDPELARTYHERAIEWNVPIAERIYCSEPTCSLFLQQDTISRIQGVVQCTAGHVTCVHCRNPAHVNRDCPQDREMARTNALAEDEGWRRCIGCYAYVEHADACQHMTCRCGAEFCYVCGLQWRTCHCTMNQLAAVKRDAAERRRAREQKEASEEAEIQEAIRLVEEFEREEALKAELLRQEQERIEEERRRKQLEERITREGERRAAVAAKYEELRDVFARLDPTQRDLVMKHQEGSELKRKCACYAALAQLRGETETDRAARRTRAEDKIAKKQAAHKAEYASRAGEERDLEGQYAAKLFAFYATKRDGNERAASLLRDFKVKMDAGFGEWKRVTDAEVERYAYDVREDLAVFEEGLDEKLRRAEAAAEGAEVTAAELRAAEMRWVDEVLAERARLLEDMWIEEIDSGEDIEAWFAEGDGDVVPNGDGEEAEIAIPGTWYDS